MKKRAFLTVVVLFIVVTVCQGAPSLNLDPWIDEVVSFDQPTGSDFYYSSNDPANALGSTLGTTVSVDIPEVLVLAFTDNLAIDGAGNDIHVYQWVAGDSGINIYGSENNNDYVFLGYTVGDIEFDLASYAELDYVKYMKFVGYDNGGTAPGYDLDAVKALHCGPVSNVPTVPAPSAIMLGLAGVGMVRAFKKKK